MRFPLVPIRLGSKRLLGLLVVLALVAVGAAAATFWRTPLLELAATLPYASRFVNGDHDHAEEDGHDHEACDHKDHEGDHEGEGHKDHDHGDDHGDADHSAEAGHPAEKASDHKHDEADSLKLSTQARANIGMRLTRVELRPFTRAVTVPGVVMERPGWSIMEVAAPMTGVVTRIHPMQGEAIEHGQPLFELRLTHEDLLQAQTEFLRTVEELEVIGSEVARLEKIAADGAIAGKTLLERKYEQQRQETHLRAQRQALLLHGLTEPQVENIVKTRTLLQNVTIHAPTEKDRHAGASQHPLQVRQLHVTQGKFVSAGATLCTLADSGELYIEGHAFEQDMPAISRVTDVGCCVSATLESKGTGAVKLEGLNLLYMDDKIDMTSRTFHFYVSLPNRVVREDRTPEGRRFVYWQFRPGQRTEINVPVEQWANRIVLPVAAVAEDGAEAYVFEANGDHFDRRAVRVEYRDRTSVVIANDGTLKPGTMVAESAAHQMQLALKSKSGGGVDPHAGHNH